MQQPSPGLYERRVFPWLNDKLNADPALVQMRADALRDAQGSTLEIGFGSGLNLEHYPTAVSKLVAVEPNPGMLERARERIARVPFTVEVIQAAAESLPLPQASVDTAVSTLTLCSVSEPEQVLKELHRVLRPDGRLVLMEHGLADDDGVARWQHRLDWLQTKLACGCHLTRPMAALLQRCGFRTDGLRQFFVPKMPRTHAWVTVGTATVDPTRA
jgi:SAM-dependent methyltransferase